MKMASMNYRVSRMKNNRLFEGLEQGDLARLVDSTFSIDEFKSKMGDDADIIVLAFTVDDKGPAQDLMNFVEKGYEWVLDGDVSSGESDNGEWTVFVELQRTEEATKQIDQLISDISNLTDDDNWRFKYRKSPTTYECSEENIVKIVPLSPEAYQQRYEKEELDRMMEAARVPMNRTAPKNAFTESLRIAAGIK